MVDQNIWRMDMMMRRMKRVGLMAPVAPPPEEEVFPDSEALEESACCETLYECRDSSPRWRMCRRERAAMRSVAVVRMRGGAQTRKMTGRET
jgi:hypothetical protein